MANDLAICSNTVLWCNGSIGDSGSLDEGSNPSGTTNTVSWCKGNMFDFGSSVSGSNPGGTTMGKVWKSTQAVYETCFENRRS